MLLVYGHDPLQMMERYTWDQLFLFGECMAVAEATRLDTFMGPIIGAMGGKWKPGGPVKALADAMRGGKRGAHRPPARPANLSPEQAKQLDDARMKQAMAWASKVKGVAVEWDE